MTVACRAAEPVVLSYRRAIPCDMRCPLPEVEEQIMYSTLIPLNKTQSQ